MRRTLLLVLLAFLAGKVWGSYRALKLGRGDYTAIQLEVEQLSREFRRWW